MWKGKLNHWKGRLITLPSPCNKTKSTNFCQTTPLNQYHKAIMSYHGLGWWYLRTIYWCFYDASQRFTGNAEFSRRPVLCSQRRRNMKKDLLQQKTWWTGDCQLPTKYILIKYSVIKLVVLFLNVFPMRFWNIWIEAVADSTNNLNFIL